MNSNIKLRKIKSYGSIKRRKPLRLLKNRRGRRMSKNIRSFSDSFVNYSNTNGKIVTYSYSSNSSNSSSYSSSSSSSSNSSSYYDSRYRKFSGGYKSHTNLEIAHASQIQSLNRERSKKRKRKKREEYQYQEEEEEEEEEGEYDSEHDSEINSRGKRRRLVGAGGHSTAEVQRRSHSRRHSEKNKYHRGRKAVTDTATPSLFTVASVFSFLAGVSLSLYNKYGN